MFHEMVKPKTCPSEAMGMAPQPVWQRWGASSLTAKKPALTDGWFFANIARLRPIAAQGMGDETSRLQNESADSHRRQGGLA